ncbi:MAG TPA: ABC transporter substrate-binding protein [Methylomirabilota bacterium]|jgi:ABC-type nitrate/sulfonate/bicarbonate transport system substrate-binding protein|nr:ABC transporter substrate-binding protein [Methylomirabilota bacterium]
MKAVVSRGLLLIVAGALGLGGAGAFAQPPAVLNAAIGANLNHVPSFVGVEKGIYLKHGIDVKLKLLNTGQEMSKALQAGEVEAIGAAFSNFPLAVERGMAAKGVVGQTGDRSGRYSDDAVSIWTRKATAITKVEDLAGRKVGTPVGGTADEYLGVLLKKKGVAREKVTVLNVPPGNLVSALQGGSVDAVAAWEPFGSLVGAKVPEAVLVSRGGGHIGYYINISVRSDLIDKNPDLVERFVIAHAEAAQWTRRHSDESAEIATRWVPGLDLAVAREALRHMVFDPRITPHTLASWDENVKILIEQKKLRSALPWQQGIELRFIDKLMKSQPQLFADLKPPS